MSTHTCLDRYTSHWLAVKIPAILSFSLASHLVLLHLPLPLDGFNVLCVCALTSTSLTFDGADTHQRRMEEEEGKQDEAHKIISGHQASQSTFSSHNTPTGKRDEPVLFCVHPVERAAFSLASSSL